MSGFSKKASQAEKPSSRSEQLFELPTVLKMLPLVSRIARDLLESQHEIHGLRDESARLERIRRNLPWTERKRRYLVQETLSDAELAKSLAASGLETIRARHTCGHRTNELLEITGRSKQGAHRVLCI